MNEEIRVSNAAVGLIRGVESWLMPATISFALHGIAVLMLWGGGWQAPQAHAPTSRVQTQLMMLTYEVTAPEPEPAAVFSPPIVAPPVVEPSLMEPSLMEPPPAVAPETVLDQGLIARQRLEEKQREREEHERVQREEQRQQEQERARQQEQELARQQEQQQEQQRQEAQRAREEQQRMAAAAQAQADAEAAAIAQYQPIHKTPPAYPRRALDSRIEGDCTVVYTVTPEGRVRKPRVVEDACDDPMFIRPSLQAASGFRYQPRVVNGQTVAVHDVRNTFRYRIQ